MRICWAQYLFLAVVVALGAATLLSGCGAKGPLFLPGDGPQRQER